MKQAESIDTEKMTVAGQGKRKKVDVVDLFMAIFPGIADLKIKNEAGGELH
ncbi:hypothetical protein [Paenibacillus illinoisensis]|uniref:Uncharacterized protein n=1 Tax=Paenibacillus illinoisensis TaxID=59845 RepID=A0A2W0C880_9BACL|nr:hypothetical protein [Paenibacillus illinoisensis]PYY28247.1 hypothetical protein PIL02S_03393 [Paenibacillus illinoisensis]